LLSDGEEIADKKSDDAESGRTGPVDVARSK
jgi:hypothetical protein